MIRDTQMTNSNVMEETFPSLHSLELIALPQLASIRSGHDPFIPRSLTQMTVEKCTKFGFTFANNLKSIEEQEASTENSTVMIVIARKLKSLDLRDVDHLKRMCMHKDLMVSFVNLTSLQLRDCNELEYLFSLSMAQNLHSLQELMIISCERIEQIVKRQTEERAITVDFPLVETLILKQLSKFTGSYGQDGSGVKWLALATVTVDECPKIQKSMLGQVDGPLLNNVSVSNCSPWGSDDRERNIVHLFDVTDELKDLIIEDLKELKKYMEMDLRGSSLRQLETFEASQCDNELSKFLSTLLDRAYNLKQLKIQRCELLEQVLDLTNFVADEQRNLKFPNLETIQLIGLRKLNCIWSKDPKGILGLGKLVKLEIIGCGLLKSPLPTALLDKLVPLKELKIESCEKIEQVVEDETEMQERSFPNLEGLLLASLPKLIKFNSGHRSFRFPKLMRLTIEKCPKLHVLSNQTLAVNEGTSDHELLNEMMLECPKLQKLRLAGLEMLEDLSQGQYSRILLCELEDVEVDSFSRLTHMWIASSEKLKTLVVRNCSSLRHLILPSNCSSLREIKICGCNNLEEVSTDPGQGKTDKTFSDLESIVSFMNPTSLQLQDCNKLEYLFSLSMAQKLPSLQELKIISCERIEQIVKRESKERAITVEFPQVETLTLQQLPKFTGSYGQHGAGVKWPALATVLVDNCPKIQRSMLGTVDRPLLNDVSVSNCSPWGSEDRESNIVYLFDLTDKLWDLKYLEIKDLKELKKYMEMDLQKSSFRQLEKFEASQCDNELSKFLSILIDRAYNLKQLKIQRCELLEQVLDLTNFVADDEQGNLKFPNLETIQLIGLRKLNCIWSKDPKGILGLGKLVKLEIIGCGFLKSPLPTALLDKLVPLKELKIESCEKIEQVVEDETEMQERSFPNLEDLLLASLPKLIKFNSGHRSFRFPKLMRLTIEKCPKLNILSNQTLAVNEGTSDHELLNEMMLECHKLQKLRLAGLEMLEDLSQGQYSRILLCELEDVEVDSFSRLTHIWIASSEKLKKLVVRNCSSLRHLILPSNCSTLTKIEISGCNNVEKISTKLDNSLNEHSAALVLFDAIQEDSSTDEGIMKIPSQLKSLVLADLRNMQLWKQEPQIPVFQNLTSLKIMRCSIKKLFSIPVAERLTDLKLLTLYGCVDMVQVLQGGGGTVNRVFQKLETLVLKHLPSLTSFCEDDVDFGEFPELKMVRVEDVPNMYTFVKNTLNTPQLKHVRLTFISKCWKENLNETIKDLHKNRDKLKDEVWKPDVISSTRHHTDAPESSSQGKF